MRWDSTDGRLVMGGQRVVVRRPRVRKAGEEVSLPSWQQFADEDPLDECTLEQMVLGVSTCNYKRSVESLPEELEPHGASKIATSRRFVAMTAEKLEAWLERDMSELGIASVMIDGLTIDDHMVIVALGIDEQAQKHTLGLWQGATENTTVVQQLLDNLIQRGLDPVRPYLFVINGSKALRKAIRQTFGKRCLLFNDQRQ